VLLPSLGPANASRNERAWRFQQVQEALHRARRTVEDVTPTVDAGRAILRLLEGIEETAATLPPDVVGQGGMRARDQIFSACAAAKKQTSNRIVKERRALDAAVEEIPKLEAQLLSFERTT